MRGLAARAAGAVLAAIAALLVLAPVAASAGDGGDIVVTVPSHDGETAITNAQLRWGLNRESGAGAYAGGCNFLSAGRAGNSAGARVWTAADGLYRAADGDVRIEKPSADGDWVAATFATKCLDASGRAVTTATTAAATGSQVVIDRGVGARAADGSLRIRWRGSFTVAFYGGMTYWSVTDPVLTLDAHGDGRLLGTASGYGASMDDLSKWVPLAAQTIVLADVHGADVASGTGFSVVPDYLGVAVPGAAQVARTADNAAYWGSFPASFVAYQRLTGQLGYWLTTGGARDAAKPATTLFVSYDASRPIAVVPPAPGGGAQETPSNPVRQRPSTRAEAPVARVAAEPRAAVPAVAAVTTLPERAALVPGASGSLPPAALPLLGSALALLVSVGAVLDLMGALPWQRRGPVP